MHQHRPAGEIGEGDTAAVDGIELERRQRLGPGAQLGGEGSRGQAGQKQAEKLRAKKLKEAPILGSSMPAHVAIFPIAGASVNFAVSTGR